MEEESFEGSGHCATCCRMPLPFGSLRFIWPFDRRSKNFIHTLKYRPSRILCRQAGDAAASVITEVFPASDWDFLMPVPASPQNYAKRKFNQAQIIASRIAASLNAARPAYPIGLLHPINVRRRRVQARVPHDERRANVRDAFALPAKADLKGRKILIIDDILTSGATTAALAAALESRAAAPPDLLVLARSDSWQHMRYRTYGFRTEIPSTIGP